MKKLSHKLLSALRNTILFFMAFITGLNVITIVLQVLFRYFFKISIGWTNELAGISLVWITFLGATLATVDETHIGFDMLIKKMKPLPKLIVKTVCNLFMIYAVSNIVYYGYNTFRIGLNTKLTSLPIRLGHAAVIVPICSAVMLIGLVVNIIRDIRMYFKKDEITEPDLGALYDDVPEEVMEKSLKASEEAARLEEGGKEK